MEYAHFFLKKQYVCISDELVEIHQQQSKTTILLPKYPVMFAYFCCMNPQHRENQQEFIGKA
jgi:hypothetical protein